MSKLSTNNCILCGKPRIVVRTYKEVVGNSTVVHTDTACPDPECQKKLDKQLDEERQRRIEKQANKPSGFVFKLGPKNKKGN